MHAYKIPQAKRLFFHFEQRGLVPGAKMCEWGRDESRGQPGDLTGHDEGTTE